MSTGHSDHAYDPHKTPESTPQSAPMSEAAPPRSSLIGGATKPIATNNPAMNKPKNTGSKVDKRTLDYVIKSGIAGGLAGCAVCFPALDRATNIHTD